MLTFICRTFTHDNDMRRSALLREGDSIHGRSLRCSHFSLILARSLVTRSIHNKPVQYRFVT
jgi:hypothetical protein